MVDSGFIKIILLMITAVFCISLFKRLHLPAVLAYLIAGVIVGPSVTSLYANPQDMHLLAEIGIVFLLFSLGLEFSLPKLMAMRNLVFGVGLSQMLLTTIVFSAIAYWFGVGLQAAVIIGGMVALSSTAIVIKQVTEMGILNNQRTQLAISVLLFQDIAVVPFLIVIPLLTADTETSLAFVLGLALLKGILVVAILLSAGKWLLPWVFREVARTRTDEVFVLTTILVALLAAGLTYSFGLSMALGAFLAGMMLGESQYKYQLEADIRPFRDILMGLFFITVGMQLDLSVLFHHGYVILPGVALLMLVKVVLVRLSARLFHDNGVDAWSAGVKLCQIGEFSFVMASMATSHDVITSTQSSILVSMGIISMAVTPMLIDRSLSLAQRVMNRKGIEMSATVVDTGDLSGHVVICGFGRVGQSVARMLKIERIPFVAIDIDPIRVQESRNAGEPLIFGDATQKDILHGAGIASAKLVLISFDQPDKAVQVIDAVQRLAPEVGTMVRTKKDYELDKLYEVGATQVVPEQQEGSLMLVSQVLHYAGVPMSRILKRIRAERRGRYDHMHGFYPGETTEITYNTEDKLEFMHAVMVNNTAYGIGKTLEELNLSRMRVSIKGLRREGKEIESPEALLELVAGDVLVISGKPRRVERAERFLLEGD